MRLQELIQQFNMFNHPFHTIHIQIPHLSTCKHFAEKLSKQEHPFHQPIAGEWLTVHLTTFSLLDFIFCFTMMHKSEVIVKFCVLLSFFFVEAGNWHHLITNSNHLLIVFMMKKKKQTGLILVKKRSMKTTKPSGEGSIYFLCPKNLFCPLKNWQLL